MHNKTKDEVIKELKSNEKQGLSNEEATKRLNEKGLNILDLAKKQNIFIKFLLQFKDILVIILLIAALVSVIVEPKDWIDSLIILLVVLLNAVLGVFQENKAEKSLEALKKLSSPTCKVLRNGKIKIIDSKMVTVGDIISVEAGDYVPADCRIIESFNLKVDESTLTGESVPVEKNSNKINDTTAIGDKKNMMFASTFVTYGRGVAIVCGIGMNTEVGKIAQMLNSEENKLTPLQHKLEQIGKIMGILSIVICVVVFALQMLTGEDALDAFKTAVALAVAAIPEGLATVVTIILSLGVNKMVKKNAIVKKLPAVETLGCTSIVCSDKTGTLTQNKMTVVTYYDGITHEMNTEKTKSKLLSYAAICSDAIINVVNGKEVLIGDPTETALISAHNKLGMFDLASVKRIKEIPFDSDRKLMSVIIEIDSKHFAITKGAPDRIFDICFNIKNQDIEKNNHMASSALRVIGVAIKEVKANIAINDIEKDMQFIGLIGMIDPERSEVKEAIKKATEAGIKTIMITGDHVVTAEAIARKLNIFKENDLSITSDELQKLSDEELDLKLERISVYARVAPSDKVRIVKAWQKKGKVVAMTGDGVNDSPALKAADIGCAMGITGTDVSKESAAMILTDDNFSTIIEAVEEGRNVYANIKKCVKYLLSSNIGEVLTIFCVSVIALITGKAIGVPLLPIHLLWINLITDSLPAFALGMEDAGNELMKDKPRGKDESFFANKLGWHIGIEGIFIGGITIAAFFIGHKVSLAMGQTMAFATLSMTQLFHAFNMKSEYSILNKKLFKNKWLIYAFIVGALLQFGVIYINGINDVFNVVPLDLTHLAISIGLAFSIVIIMEVYKLFKKALVK